MSNDQLPEDLAALFAAERAAPVVVEGAKAIVKAKLAASVAGVPLGASASLLGGAGKLISVLALSFGIGAGAIAVSRGGSEPVDVPPPPRVEIVEPVISAHVEPDRPSASSIAAPVLVPVAPPARPVRRAAIEQRVPVAVDPPVALPDVPPPPDTSPAPSPPSQPAAPSVSPVAEAVAAAPPAPAPESSLLAQAWSALSRRDAAHALVLVRDGERAYPGGPLTEEREAIRISALSQLHRRDESRAAAARFLSNYPHSIHRPLVQRAIEEAP